MSVQDEIKKQVTSHKVVLYMKGSPDFRMCFSGCSQHSACLRPSTKMFTVNVLKNGNPSGHQAVRQLADDSATYVT